MIFKTFRQKELERKGRNYDADLRKARRRAAAAPAAAPEPSADQAAIELAYGLLWFCSSDRRAFDGRAMQAARHVLRDQLDHAGQGRGIAAARHLVATRALESRTNPRTEPWTMAKALNPNAD